MTVKADPSPPITVAPAAAVPIHMLSGSPSITMLKAQGHTRLVVSTSASIAYRPMAMAPKSACFNTRLTRPVLGVSRVKESEYAAGRS